MPAISGSRDTAGSGAAPPEQHHGSGTAARTPRSLVPQAVVFALVAAAAILAIMLAGGHTAPSQADRVEHIAAQLRCPVCEGESVAQSDSAVSMAMKAQIASEVAAGQSDQTIVRGFAAQYGAWIVAEPPTSGWIVLAWAAPAAAFVGGLVLAVSWLRSRPKAPRSPKERDTAGSGGSDGTKMEDARPGQREGDPSQALPGALEDYF